jgi:hypothetical protein
MISSTRRSRSIGDAYAIIGDAGAVTVDEFASLTSVTTSRAGSWLRRHADAGYLHRDEFGAYRTSCPWPRPGF